MSLSLCIWFRAAIPSTMRTSISAKQFLSTSLNVVKHLPFVITSKGFSTWCGERLRNSSEFKIILKGSAQDLGQIFFVKWWKTGMVRIFLLLTGILDHQLFFNILSWVLKVLSFLFVIVDQISFFLYSLARTNSW